MIQFVEMECPNCGGPLTKTGDNTAKCSHCGAEFLIDNGQPERITNVHPSPAPQKNNRASILSVVTVFLLIAIGTICLIASRHTGSEIPQAAVEKKEPVVYSAFFEGFVENVFGMSPEQITPEQLAKVKYLHISRESDNLLVEYSIDDGKVQSILLAYERESCNQDIKKFAGLQTLDLENLALSEGDLAGVNELTEIRTRNSPDELAKIVPHPEKITVLGSYSASGILGIDVFSNLEQLSVTCSDELSDIGSLSALKELKCLTLERADSITDWGVLQSLTALEELSINSRSLKDVSFLKHLTALKKLSITDSILLDLSPIGKLTSLTEVLLEDNTSIDDYSALSKLSNLETLTLELGYDKPMPSVKNWRNLTSLSVSRVDNIDFLTSLPKLQSLCISGCSSSDYTVLSSLKNLESLKLSGIYGDISNPDVLSGMKNLKSLDISSVTIYGNVEFIFGIQGLENLNIDDCSFGLDFAAMPENTGLKTLHMNRIKLWKNIEVEYDGVFTNVYYDDVSLDAEINFVSKFPNLEELYLQSNKLTGVEFTENLPNLRKLDITDNYVTDLRPLGTLQYLDTVWCGENSISQGLNLGKQVTVISDSEKDEP